VQVFQGDVSQVDSLRQVLGRIAATMPPLRGVFHAVLVFEHGTLLNLGWDRFVPVLAPKVEGTWNLHELTRDLDLDLFVLFSSIGSMLGLPGEANYAAANAFQDALAYHRRALGLPAVSINWSTWTDPTEVADVRQSTAYMATQGVVGLITPEQGLATLQQILTDGRTQVGAFPIDWAKYARQFHPRPAPPMVAALVQRAQAGQRQAAAARPELLPRLEKARPEQYRDLTVAFVRQLAAQVLRLDVAAVDAAQDLKRYGLDSLLALELRGALAAAVGHNLPATLLFDYPSPEAVADHLLTDVLHLRNGTAGPEADRQQSRLAELETLSEDEVEHLLWDKLRGTV
jgi:acyl carrier protein